MERGRAVAGAYGRAARDERGVRAAARAVVRLGGAAARPRRGAAARWSADDRRRLGRSGRRPHARRSRGLVAAMTMPRTRRASRPPAAGRLLSRPAWLVIVLAVLVLVVPVVPRPPHAPPLYDGVGFPDEPYRWVVPPHGEQRTPLAATEAFVRLPVSDGISAAGRAQSGEQGPQVTLAALAGTFALPDGAPSITLRAVPQAVPAVKPAHGQVISNLYLLTAQADGTAVQPAAGNVLRLDLRAVRRTPQEVVICHWNGAGWEQVPTYRMGADIYFGWLGRVGPIALVQLDPGIQPGPFAPDVQAAPSDPGPGAQGIWLGLGLIVVLVAGTLLVLRRRTA